MTAAEARALVAEALATGDTTADVAAALRDRVACCGDEELLRLLRVLRKAEDLADVCFQVERCGLPTAGEVAADDAWCALRDYVEKAVAK